MRAIAASIAAVGIALASAWSVTQAAAPVQPNCLGQDVSQLQATFHPWGKNVVSNLASDGGGFNDEVLGHLQGVPPISSCPDGGFPSHIP